MSIYDAGDINGIGEDFLIYSAAIINIRPTFIKGRHIKRLKQEVLRYMQEVYLQGLVLQEAKNGQGDK